MKFKELIELSERIRKARVLAKLSVKELSGITGISYATLSRIERGERIINAIELQKIAHATGKPITFFYENGRLVETFDPSNFYRH